jgi:flagellar hook-basal body complex protein FliE
MNGRSITGLSGLGGMSSLTGGQDIKQMLSGLDLEKLQQAAGDEVKRAGTAFTNASEGLKGLLEGTTSAEDAGRSIFSERPMGSSGGDSFASMLGGLVDSVDTKFKASEQAAEDIMLGKSDNIHQAMISMQEASLSFDLLVQVRNKLVDSYKELSRMTV